MVYQLSASRISLDKLLKSELDRIKGLKLSETLKVTFKKDVGDDKTTYKTNCHVIGKYRGSAHKDCNVKFRPTKKISVIFHNLRGYDSHFIMQEIGKLKQEINVIPNTMEKYMAFMIGKHLVFLDSFQFMSSSLDNLVKNISDFAFR